MTSEDVLKRAGLTPAELRGGSISVRSPIDGAELARIRETPPDDMPAVIDRARSAFLAWRAVPAPRRGELVRLLGEELRASKEALGALVTLEVGKIVSEGLGEVQEMIDICDFAVGLSRQLYGLVIASERPGHRMMEPWHPLGPVRDHLRVQLPGCRLGLERDARAGLRRSGDLEAIGENAALGAGDDEDPRPRDQALGRRARRSRPDLSSADPRSARRWSHPAMCRWSRPPVRPGWADRRAQGRRPAGPSLLELGGNNAMIVAPSADLDLAVRAIVFAAVGTAGQRCTTLRRLIVHRSIRADLTHRLVKAYASLPIGDPRKEGMLVGPLIDDAARDRMQAALKRAKAEGGVVHGGGTVTEGAPTGGVYVEPAIVEMPGQTRNRARGDLRADPLRHGLRRPRRGDRDPERRAAGPVFVDLHPRHARGGTFLSATGSDCGIANVNIGTSGSRDRRRVRRREGDRRRPRERLRRLEGLHAPADEHGQLFRSSCRWRRG